MNLFKNIDFRWRSSDRLGFKKGSAVLILKSTCEIEPSAGKDVERIAEDQMRESLRESVYGDLSIHLSYIERALSLPNPLPRDKERALIAIRNIKTAIND